MVPTPTLDTLPGEIFLQILSYLGPREAVKLQLVCRELYRTGRDSGFWRSLCFDDSSYLESIRRRSRLQGEERKPVGTAQERERDRIRLAANWDPAFPGEKVSWYDEYVQRNAPIVTSWFQRPKTSKSSAMTTETTEVRGVALYRPHDPRDERDGTETLFAVSPLGDGSVCLWDVNGTRGRPGSVVAQSRPGLLFVSRPDWEHPGPDLADLAVTECVSVDSHRHLAFFAVQNHLVEVDLQRLAVVSAENFPGPITALSISHPAVPLTVGTGRGLHFHDRRAKTVDKASRPSWAPHPKPGPLSILHLQRAGSQDALSHDIYTAGRIPSILHYDRRNLASIQDTIHSGASLCGLTAMPYPFSALDAELRREGLMPLCGVEKAKAAAGCTIVACGEYKTKGSLELYGIGTVPSTTQAGETQSRHDATFKNRQTSAFSKILSVANHGTRLVFSDGAGAIKWFERDGCTEVRSFQIGIDQGGPQNESPPSALFSSSSSAESGDMARKLVPTRTAAAAAAATAADTGATAGSLENNGVLVWTGEKLGLVRFSSQPGTSAMDFDEAAKTEAELAAERQERAYSSRMRELLELQANDVRFVRHLGYGSSGRRG